MHMKSSRRGGFTLVEIMIVVAIIGLLAAVAIPNYVRARLRSQQAICINNLRVIADAMQELQLERPDEDPHDPANVQPYLGRAHGGVMPVCPVSRSNYDLSDEIPVCTLSPQPVDFEHVLPQ